MYDQNRFQTKLIKSICKEENIKFELLSHGYVIQMTKGDVVKHIIANKFDLNEEASGRIASDKYATYSVLKSKKIPVCEHIMIFNPKSRKEYIPEEGNLNIIKDSLKKWGKIVVKENDGCEGYNVFLCENIKEAKEATNLIFAKKSSLSVSPFYDSYVEYRAFYLDGEIKLIYEKHKPYVIGDGVSKIRQLIKKSYPSNIKVSSQDLKKINLDYIPKKDEKVEISWKFNLCGGAIPRYIKEGSSKYNNIKDLALKVGKVMNMRFATIDILDTKEYGLKALEINSGVTGTIFSKSIKGGNKLIKDIYKQAILNMFK